MKSIISRYISFYSILSTKEFIITINKNANKNKYCLHCFAYGDDFLIRYDSLKELFTNLRKDFNYEYKRK